MRSARSLGYLFVTCAMASSCRLTPFSDDPPISYENVPPAATPSIPQSLPQPTARGGGPADETAASEASSTPAVTAPAPATTAPYLANEGTGFFAPTARGGGPTAEAVDTTAPPTARGGGERGRVTGTGSGSTNFFSGPAGRPADAPPARPADAPQPAAIAPPVMEAGAPGAAPAAAAASSATAGATPTVDANANANAATSATNPSDANAAAAGTRSAQSVAGAPRDNTRANNVAATNGATASPPSPQGNATSPTGDSNANASTNRWANRGPSGTPVGAGTPGTDTSQSSQRGHDEAPPEPVREQQFVIRAPNATSLVTPPTHPGAQPVLLAIGASCTNEPPACPIAAGLASGYGWSLCVQPRTACDPEANTPTEPAIDHAALGDIVQRLSATRGAEVQSANTIVVASGDHANALLSTAPPTDTRTREILLVAPDTESDITLAATLPFTRIAWIDAPNARGEAHEKRDAVADQLAQRGIPFAAISPKDRSDRARSEAVVRALAWLRAGGDSHVCDARTPRTTRVTVRCNGVGDDASASR